MEQKEKHAGIATAEQLERRLSSIALGRVKKPDAPKVNEQLKAIELLMKIRGMLEQETEAKPLEVKIRVLDSNGKELKPDGTGSDAPPEGFYAGEGG